ncbi:DNA/RNA endonuclease YhcR with UshA esterase domain [Saonia flava]|uniref:DNA/RNA endonuclease YhcR with UshA esterase domain n=1 Tax=Saonia flava TaxID=523696 RepID=A0A846QUC9_9FLAO|nr:hypothetical protein [Saonia flava]NJB70142.1 DNA/RNA endonuclease YhcR with UshA esterase domain [Saonia flava]
MSKKKYYLLVSLIALLFFLALLVKQYLYGEHRNIASEKATMEISATELESRFASNQSLTSKNLLDKVIAVHGKINAIEINSVIIDNKVQANLLNGNMDNIAVGDIITVKGRCIGYDDLLEIVKIDQATQILN